jgi:hypothetical protein
MIDPDPFTQTYAQIWHALAARTEWVALFPAGRRGDKETITGRLTEIIKARNLNGLVSLDQAQWAGQPFGANSLVVSAQHTYVMSVASGSSAIEKVNDIKWQTLLALRAAGPDLGLPQFITSYLLQQAQDRPQPQPQQGGQSFGYASVLWITVAMNIDSRLV